MQFAVVFEMYSHTFRPCEEWARDLRSSFRWLVAAGTAAAMGLTWLATPDTQLWMQGVVIKGSFFSSALMSEFFVGMIALSVRAGLPWKTYVAKISQGLGIYSILDVLIEAGHSYLGVDRNTQMYMTACQSPKGSLMQAIAWTEPLAPGPLRNSSNRSELPLTCDRARRA